MEERAMRSKIWLAFSLLTAMAAVPALAYPQCSCSCQASCTATCSAPGIGLTSCGAMGQLCSTNPACGGSGCDAVVAGAMTRLLSQRSIVAVGGDQGRAAARLTWR